MGVARDEGAHLARGERAVRREHALHRDGPAAEAAAEHDGAVRAVADHLVLVHRQPPDAPAAAAVAATAPPRGAGAQEEKEAEPARGTSPDGIQFE